MKGEGETPQGAIHFLFYAQPEQEWRKRLSKAQHWELRTQLSHHDQKQQGQKAKAWTI
jgi:hypothetical protein